MIELGKRQELEVVRIKEFGVYLAEGRDEKESVLLPKKQVPEGTKIGDKLKVFIYKDSEDRLIATIAEPKLTVGETAVLKVKDVSRIGAFLDMGLEKELLLPFKEQNRKVNQGDECLVALYIDKSGRLAATTNVYKYLSAESPYKADDKVEGIVYELHDTLGAFVAVSEKYFGLIPKKELVQKINCGDRISVRITRVRPDGKLDLSPRNKAYQEIGSDSDVIIDKIKKNGGKLNFTDHADPEIIKREVGLSKNAFKRAVGHLLKEKKVVIKENSIELTK